MPRFLAPITVDQEFVTGNETISGSETILGTTSGRDSYWTSVNIISGLTAYNAYFHTLTSESISSNSGNSDQWTTAYKSLSNYLPLSGGTLTNGLTGTKGIFTTSLSAPSLSGVYYGDGSHLTGVTHANDLSAYLPLAGGTLTGNLTGVDAYFTNSVYAHYLSGGFLYGDGSALGGVAKLFSPAFEGIPTAPTATAQTNTTQIATTQFVIQNSGDRYVTTSTSTLGLNNNNGISATVGTGLSYVTGQDIVVVHTPTQYILATVVSYNTATGLMVYDGNSHVGTGGPFSTWTINVGGVPASGSLLASNNLTDVGSVSTALINLGGFPKTGGTLAGGLTATVGKFEDILFIPSASAPSYEQGKLFYDATADALCYYNLTTNNRVHVGQEIQQQVKNSTNSTIPKGTPVYITGAFGEYAGVAPAKADTVLTSILVGVTNQDILSGQIGFVVTAGSIDSINTSGYAAGSDMYLSPLSAGKMTATLPSAPDFAVQVGVCLYVHPTNGKMVVNNAYIGTFASTVIGAISISQGGTGQTSASAALSALGGLPITGGTLTNGLTGTRGVFTTSLSAPALSGTHYGDGSNLTGITKVLDWMTLVRGYNTIPTLLATIGSGDVYTYVYNSTPSNITYYRFIATDGNTDAFYTYFSGSALSGLVARKSIVL